MIFEEYFEQCKLFLPQFLKEVEISTNIVITSHINADPDSLASSISLKYFLHKLFPQKNISVVLPQMNKITEKLYKEILVSKNNFKILKSWPNDIDLLIMVDTSDIKMTELPSDYIANENLSKIKKLVIIDHHLSQIKENQIKSFNVDTFLNLILEKYSSSAEIIYTLIEIQNIIIPLEIIKIILLAIMTDTGHFRYANSVSLENTKKLLDCGKLKISDINSYLNEPITRSEKIARIKGAKRVEKIYYINDFLIAFSHVSSYEASACKALIELGYDVAFVVAIENQNFRVSSRAKESVIRKTSLHLGEILSKLGLFFNGSGGGHDGAAGCYGILKNTVNKKKSNTFMPMIINPIMKLLKQKFD